MNTIQIHAATHNLNSNAANYGDEATYEFYRIVNEIERDHFVLAFKQIVNGRVVKVVRVEFIVQPDGSVVPN